MEQRQEAVLCGETWACTWEVMAPRLVFRDERTSTTRRFFGWCSRRDGHFLVNGIFAWLAGRSTTKL